jgi:hypothetical protein
MSVESFHDVPVGELGYMSRSGSLEDGEVLSHFENNPDANFLYYSACTGQTGAKYGLEVN